MGPSKGLDHCGRGKGGREEWSQKKTEWITKERKKGMGREGIEEIEGRSWLSVAKTRLDEKNFNKILASKI